MDKSKEKTILERYDKMLAISFLMLTLALAIIKILGITTSLYLYNFLCTIIVPLFFIVISKIRINKKLILPIIVIFFSAIFNFVIGFSNLNNEDKINELTYCTSLIINLLMIYGVIYSNKKFGEEHNFKYMNITVIVIAIGFCIYNIVSNANQFLYFASAKYRNLISFKSFFANRNNFGIFLLFAIISTFYVKQNLKYKKTIKIIQCFFIINLFLTLSRSSVIALMIFIFSYLLLTRKKKKYIIAIIVMILLIVIVNPFNITGIISGFLIREDAGTSGRVELWKNSLSLISQKPITGYGSTLSGNLFKKITTTSNFHNFYIKIMASHGIIGFVSFMYIIIGLLKNNIAIYKKNNEIGALCISTLLCLLVYGITEEINFFYFGILNLMITYFTFILPMHYYNDTRRDRDGK